MTPAATRERRRLRIGELADLTGTTPRTIRYYEEIGLLPEVEDRLEGKRRLYEESDVDRLREIMRLRDLLGLSLEELRDLVQAENARAALREEWHRTENAAEKRRILEDAAGHLATQLRLVRHRKKELGRLERELLAKQRRQRSLLRDLA